MRIIKGIISFILSLLLVATSAVALASFALEEAVSDDSIHIAAQETGAASDLVESLLQNVDLNLVQLLDSENSLEIQIIQALQLPEVRYGAIGFTAIICLILLIMYRGRLGGVLKCAIPILLVAGFYWIMSAMLEETMVASSSFVEEVKRLLYVMISCGLKYAAVLGGMAGFAFLPIWPLARLILKERKKEER